ncbi:hypothetical protein NADFUDRAFT_47875 [Nadsonia fulvescens var. elongata DSM 6958]|uniref:Uncharacterized protein n=1 Tax=Nadsonia fulvescens var. elongata DSM 6958 TaxID=857566 RepID=A0A1E3PE41_9ASCO|nr:hypothetical protein NADFUDRAFT_47875 [Nadsonia fulvescens var. elongata DSM 6958]
MVSWKRLVSTALLAFTVGTAASTGLTEAYPTSQDDAPNKLSPFNFGNRLAVECIDRNIDNGEHKFDEAGNVVYTAFPTCRETTSPLSFKYGVDETFNCTVGFTDTLFHLFQFYIHEDVPFSCRIAASSSSVDGDGLTIPLTFNFRGHITDSHLDIDSDVKAIFLHSKESKTPVSAVAFSAGTETSRYIIGEYMTIQLSTRWYAGEKGRFNLPSYASSHFNSTTFAYCIATFIATSALIIVIFQGVIFPKRLRSELMGNLSVYNNNSDFYIEKRD